MKHKGKITIGLLVFLAVAVMTLVVVVKYAGTPEPVKKIVDTGVVKSEPILVEWVYKNSSRISRTTAKEIVTEALKTPKPLITLAIMSVESEFVPTAVSNKGALGLMQINPVAWEKDLFAKNVIKERRDLFNIDTNIKVGGYIFHVCMTQAKGDVEKALEAYLGGKDGGYVKRILLNLATLYSIAEVRLT